MKAWVRFADYVRPDGYPPEIERRFGVFQWMVRTAHGMTPTVTWWGTQGPIELLSCKPSCVNFREVDPVTSVADLDRRFHFALLSAYGSPAVDRWRAEHRIGVDEERWIYFPHRRPWTFPHRRPRTSGDDHSDLRDDGPAWGPSHRGGGRCEALLCRQVAALLSASGRTRIQLNPCHADADQVLGVRIFVHPSGFRFVLDYGVDGSWWHHVLAESLSDASGDAFVDVLDRACEEMIRIADWPEGRMTAQEFADAQARAELERLERLAR